MDIIPFTGEISESRIVSLLEALQSERTHRRVLIDSPGGTFEFFSTLSPALVRTGFTAIASNVQSAAMILQLLGHQRLALPDATFFFHEVRTVLEERGEVTICDLDEFMDREKEALKRFGQAHAEIAEWRRRMSAAQNWMLSFIYERTGLSAGRFMDLMRAEATLTAREARQYGIVHEIVSLDELLAKRQA